MHRTIKTLPGSDLYHADVELYRRHNEANDGSGRCVTCGHPNPCPSKQGAAKVILAAGEIPQFYDQHLPSARHSMLGRSGVTRYTVSSRWVVAHETWPGR